MGWSTPAFEYTKNAALPAEYVRIKLTSHLDPVLALDRALAVQDVVVGVFCHHAVQQLPRDWGVAQDTFAWDRGLGQMRDTSHHAVTMASAWLFAPSVKS